MTESIDETFVGPDPEGWSEDEISAPDYDPDSEVAIPARWRITDDSAAAWAMRKLRAIERRRQSNATIAEEETKRIKDWLAGVDAPLHREAQYFEAILGHYALGCRLDPADGRKTISLPAGKVSTRAGSDRWTVDNETFLTWARINAPTVIRVREEAALSEVKVTFIPTDDGRAVTDEGEVVPGVQVMQTGASATVSPDLS